jgi:hypothetical protein
MKESQIIIGTTGYTLLIFGAAFLNIPILGLLAIPLFLASSVMLIYFFVSLCDKKSHKIISTGLIIIGIILLWVTIGITAVQYSEYLLALSRDNAENFFPSPGLTALKTIGSALIASLIITYGIKLRSTLSNKKLLYILIGTYVSVPLTILLIKILELIHMPFGT